MWRAFFVFVVLFVSGCHGVEESLPVDIRKIGLECTWKEVPETEVPHVQYDGTCWIMYPTDADSAVYAEGTDRCSDNLQCLVVSEEVPEGRFIRQTWKFGVGAGNGAYFPIDCSERFTACEGIQ